MTTPPFAAARETNLKATIQGGHLAMLKQWQDTPQFFCCISGNTVGVDKDPVPVLTIDDRVVCIGDDVTVDFSRSWSPTDSLAGQPYTISWGDGSPDTNGNFPNPRNAAAETETYVGGYAAVGFYDITIEVQDSLGATASTTLQVYARDCSLAPNPLPWPPPYEHPIWTAGGMMVADDDEVYYTTDFDAASPTWTAFAGGFGGSGIRDAKTVLDDGTETVYVLAQTSGIYSHPMPPSGGAWTSLQTATNIVDAALGVSATRADSLYRLAVYLEDPQIQWCTWYGVDGNDRWVGVGYTEDGWATIKRSVTVTSELAAANGRLYIAGISVVQQSGGQIVLVHTQQGEDVFDPAKDKYDRIYVSYNAGLTWSILNTRVWTGTMGICELYVPYSGQGLVMYSATRTELRRSVDGGASWATADSFFASTLIRLNGPYTDAGVCTYTIDDELWEYRDGATTHLTPNMPGGELAWGVMGLERNSNGYGTEILWVGGSSSNIRVKTNDGAGGQDNKEGNWPGAFGADPPRAIIQPELGEYST